MGEGFSGGGVVGAGVVEGSGAGDELGFDAGDGDGLAGVSVVLVGELSGAFFGPKNTKARRLTATPSTTNIPNTNRGAGRL